MNGAAAARRDISGLGMAVVSPGSLFPSFLPSFLPSFHPSSSRFLDAAAASANLERDKPVHFAAIIRPSRRTDGGIEERKGDGGTGIRALRLKKHSLMSRQFAEECKNKSRPQKLISSNELIFYNFSSFSYLFSRATAYQA